MGISMARPEGYVKNPQNRMNAMASFLRECGNPQTGIPAVHVAGTSGKGSVCAAVTGILREAGLNVGLHISPYLQSATEKIWINDKFVDGNEFSSLVDWVMPIAAPKVRPETPASVHGMASVAIAFEAFRRKKVDVMVFEAGCGARYDLTSFVDTKVAVVTNVGLDHLISLGPTIEKIAWHKAGVARPHAPLITGATGSPLEVIQSEATKSNCSLIHIPPCEDKRRHNARIATAAAKHMAAYLGLELDENIITQGLKRVRLSGRMEQMPNNGTRVFLDGAHNGDKLRVAVDTALENHYKGPKVAVIGFLGTKASPELLSPIAGRFDHVIATAPTVYGKTSYPCEDTAALLRQIGYSPTVEASPMNALQKALHMTKSNGTVLATGSFYLVGALREHWYPKKEVVLACSSWPHKI